MLTRRQALASLAALALALPACSGSREGEAPEHAPLPPKAEATKPTKVTIAQWGQEKYLIYLPLYVAMERGYFANEGIEVTLKYTGNDDQTFAAVIQGDADFGVGDPVFTAISQERGFPAKVVATLVGGVAIWGVTKNPSITGISTPADLAGLRVGTFPDPSTNYALMKGVISQNPDILAHTKIVQAPIGSQLALVEKGDADIGMVLEPAASLAESEGFRVVYSSPAFHGPFAFTGLTVAQSTIDGRPDLVQRVVNALELAMVESHHDPNIAREVGKSLFPRIDPTVVDSAVKRMLDEATYPPHALVDDSAWQAAITLRTSIGDLKEPQATSVSVDNAFALEAQKNADGSLKKP